ncbi:MAG: hypothetical protein UV03_C0005G0012 [candidate division WWE3 bacterium GW2011_GWE1_42_16]|nr:MAG: hypothetical protein UV03_C0005G0012 [candidate division WWE3 bacterium GW2011_GWE1_42_16]
MGIIRLARGSALTGLCFNNGYLSGKITLRFQAITALLGDRLMVGLESLSPSQEERMARKESVFILLATNSSGSEI